MTSSSSQLAVIPAGKPVAVPIPVAPVVVCVISVKAVLIHKVGVAEANPAVFSGVTVMVPVASASPQPPVKGMVYKKVPLSEGVPLMVIASSAQAALTPAGKPLAAPMPVAPVVSCVMAVSVVLMHKVGVAEAVPAVLSGVTVIVPVALTLPQPPVSGMLYWKVPLSVGVPLMVMRSSAQLAVTPAGRSLAVPIPVAPVVVCVMSVSIVLIHKVGVTDAVPTVLTGVTVMVPVASASPHPPVKGIVYMKVPLSVGVPVIVIVLASQLAVRPAGRPLAVPMPVAPVVEWVTSVS